MERPDSVQLSQPRRTDRKTAETTGTFWTHRDEPASRRSSDFRPVDEGHGFSHAASHEHS
jgi:hypothetical protein